MAGILTPAGRPGSSGPWNRPGRLITARALSSQRPYRRGFPDPGAAEDVRLELGIQDVPVLPSVQSRGTRGLFLVRCRPWALRPARRWVRRAPTCPYGRPSRCAVPSTAAGPTSADPRIPRARRAGARPPCVDSLHRRALRRHCRPGRRTPGRASPRTDVRDGAPPTPLGSSATGGSRGVHAVR